MQDGRELGVPRIGRCLPVRGELHRIVCDGISWERDSADWGVCVGGGQIAGVARYGKRSLTAGGRSDCSSLAAQAIAVWRVWTLAAIAKRKHVDVEAIVDGLIGQGDAIVASHSMREEDLIAFLSDEENVHWNRRVTPCRLMTAGIKPRFIRGASVRFRGIWLGMSAN